MNFEACRRLVQESGKIVGFSGAGISTSSGIPDFRSPQGVWSRNRTITFQEFVANDVDRIAYWQQKFTIWQEMREAEPNAGHLAFASLHAQNKLLAMITQNIDGLHQKSGLPEERIIELHGTTRDVTCLQCHIRSSMDEACARIRNGEKAPICTSCGGYLKPAVVSFGQAMPLAEMERASQAATTCDLMIVVGSSLVVYPAAGFPALAKQSGAKVILINREPTPLDHLADALFPDEIDEVLPRLVG